MTKFLIKVYIKGLMFNIYYLKCKGGVAPRQVATLQVAFRQWRIIKMLHLAKLHLTRYHFARLLFAKWHIFINK